MNLFELYADLPNINKLIVCFRADIYSALFFSLLIKSLKEQLRVKSVVLQTIDIENHSFDEIKRMASVSFLGQNHFYWFKDVSSDAQLLSKWQSFCTQYSGPHTLLFFSKAASLKESAQTISIDLPKVVDIQTYQKLATLFYPDQSFDIGFFTQFFQKHQQISLDQACLIMQYQTTLGRRFEQFLYEWADKIISPEYSLFVLSQHLFAQEYQAFFALLHQFKAEYPDEFWIAFWSEQLWQAILYSTKAVQQSPIEAKKLVNRLPFTFMNKDWKRFPVSFLIKAHQELYLIDYMFKNGNNEYALELWYHKFFLRKF